MKYAVFLFSCIMMGIAGYTTYSYSKPDVQGKTEYRDSCNSKSEEHGMTQFPCTFPCPWRDKTFDLYLFGISSPYINWTIDTDGKSSSFDIVSFDCYQMMGRFLVIKVPERNDFFCLTISYDPTDNPVKFFIFDGAVKKIENKTDAFEDICEICGSPDVKLLGVEAGFPRPADEPFECNSPPQCGCCHNCTVCSVCDKVGSIQQACPESKTHQYHRQQSYRFPRQQSYRFPRRHAAYRFHRRQSYRLPRQKAAYRFQSRQSYLHR